ncbi:MAG: voltage-gated potassium channel [Pseudonocardiales bacterium]|nr:voltage-gated potassium channel [Pseudonocardiales bacterium]
MDSTPVQRWEQRTEWPLALLAVTFLITYAWPILQENLSSEWRATCRWVGYLVWLAFFVDYVVRVMLATDRGHYISRHILDVLVIVLPVLRPLRLLRLVMLLRVMNRRATSSLRGRVIVYVVGSTALVITASRSPARAGSSASA